MAYVDTTAGVAADAGLAVVALALRPIAGRCFSRILALVAAVDAAILALGLARGAVFGSEMPAWAMLLFTPLQLSFVKLHLLSLIVLGGDEIIERHGLILTAVAAAGDLVLWALLFGLPWRGVGNNALHVMKRGTHDGRPGVVRSRRQTRR